MKAKSILGVAALALSSASMAQSGAATSTDEQGRPKTRAEVRADLAMWQRAGLGSLYNSEAMDPNDPQVQRRLAEYSRLRNGPEYQAELQRLQGDEAQRRVSGSGAAGATTNTY